MEAFFYDLEDYKPEVIRLYLGQSVLLFDDTVEEIEAKLDKALKASQEGGPF